MGKKIKYIFLGIMLAAPLFATQQHGEPTGLVVHEIAHILFIYAMAIIMKAIHSSSLKKIKGWQYLYMAALFFLIWNLVAFSIHIMQEYIPKDAYSKEEYWFVSLSLNKAVFLRVTFYIGRLIAPILNIIPFVYLYKSVKSFSKIAG